MKRFLSLAMVLVLSLALLTGCGNKVSGKYILIDDSETYYNFLDDGKAEAGHLGVILEGDYEISEETNEIKVTLYLEAFGAKVPVEHMLTINEDGSLTEALPDMEFTYVKEK